ncbi:AAA family ATPase [Actinomycetospora aeridis]|uniref:MoxR family ATPase n=1 Tax=Actinomycetospora aeridis TaxID=3129231 RepID=A0ABU8N5V6_9PSEU
MSRPDKGGDFAISAVLEDLDRLQDRPSATGLPRGDARDGEVYVITDAIRTAIKVAVITGRPLLLGGPPGCGKSSLASYLARNLGVVYDEFVATEESTPADLLWTFDAVRRLGDAQADRLRGGRAGTAAYVEPGPLWWAFDPGSARRRGLEHAEFERSGLEPAIGPAPVSGSRVTRSGAVVLIDEIDKADLSFCNGLLVPFGSKQFAVPELGLVVRTDALVPTWSPLTIITTNHERDLPDAFVRRCVVLNLKAPTSEELVEIVERHFTTERLDAEQLAVVERLANSVGESGALPSTSEFLDLVNVALTTPELHQDPATWALVEQMTVARVGRGRRLERRWAR